jgi:major membrane immunogen (membrane-anchored lipoprotein)
MRIVLIVGLTLSVMMLLAVTVACGIKMPTKKTTASVTEPTTAIDDRNTNFRPDASVLKNTVQAGKRVAQLNDFQQMSFFILAYDLENNRMPTKEEIVADLKNYPDASEILKKINEGVIILTGTKDKNALWAYEVDADKAGGIVCTGPSGAIKRATASEVKQLLGK